MKKDLRSRKHFKVVKIPAALGPKFKRLVNVVAKLQAPGGCPWDREQTHASLKPYMVEEVYEAMEAIDEKDYPRLAEELGDMLLHICMHAEMARREKKFTIGQVIDTIADKMIRRHPHVFPPVGLKGKPRAQDVAAVWKKWEEIKQEEKTEAKVREKVRQRGKVKTKGMLETVPKNLPALYRAERVQKRASRVGFDWGEVAGAWDKVYEELNEVHAILKSQILNPKSKRGAIKNSMVERLKEEIGDLLFAIVNVARKLDISPEEALQDATAKFIRRFAPIEAALKRRKLTLKEMDAIWEKQK
jgi:tetrapyrrole methylase family protein/MazG family protein